MISYPSSLSSMPLKISIDLIAIAAAFPTALLGRFDFSLSAASEWGGGLVLMLAVAIVLQLVVGRLWGLYTGRWNYGSFEEFAALVGTAVCLTAGTMMIDVALTAERRPLPLGATAGGGVLAFIAMAGMRYIWRAWEEYSAGRRGRTGHRVLIAGAGDAGTLVAREMRRNPHYGLRPVGFVDDDPEKQNLRVAGTRVLGTTEEMHHAATTSRADSLLIAMPSGGPETVKRLTDLAAVVGLEPQIVPHVLAHVNGSVSLEDIRAVRVEDLLGREPVRTDLASMASYISGKTVLVTGAGGSIGQELCRQVQALNPFGIVLLDHDETNLHSLEMAIRGEALLQSPAIVIADIRDRERMRSVFAQWKPHVVLHAAAHKHLPLLELHPSEGVKTNVTATLNVAEAAIEHRTERFIFISTDKAAHPSSVLGATKRVGELLVQELGLNSPTIFTAVRFGNVLGSRGSVISVFEQQIDAGGPITVTHPDVTRYFMTIEEACQLVLQAGAFARAGEVFVLDMGEPMKIVELARKMAQFARPNEAIPIKFTGLRPGEKLHEDLFFEHEEHGASPHPKIFVSSTPTRQDPEFWDRARHLIEAADSNDDTAAVALLSDLVESYSPASPDSALLETVYPDGL